MSSTTYEYELDDLLLEWEETTTSTTTTTTYEYELDDLLLEWEETTTSTTTTTTGETTSTTEEPTTTTDETTSTTSTSTTSTTTIETTYEYELDDLLLEWETTSTTSTSSTTTGESTTGESTSTTTTAETTSTTTLYPHFPIGPSGVFRILTMTCTHWRQIDAGYVGGPDGPNYDTLLPLQLTLGNDNNAELILHAGDLVYNKNWLEANDVTWAGEVVDILNANGLPWYFAPGNHDLDVGRTRFEAMYEANGVNLDFPKKIQIGGWDAIILDFDWSTYNDTPQVLNYFTETITWLENNLDNSRPTIILTHPFLIVATNTAPTYPQDYMPQNVETFLSTLNTYGNSTMIVLSGHDHNGPKWYQRPDGTWLLTVKRSDGYWDNQPDNHGVSFLDIGNDFARFWSLDTDGDFHSEVVLFGDPPTTTTTTTETTSTTTELNSLIDDIVLEWETTSTSTTTAETTSTTTTQPTTTQPTTSTSTTTAPTTTTTAETTSTTTGDLWIYKTKEDASIWTYKDRINN